MRETLDMPHTIDPPETRRPDQQTEPEDPTQETERQTPRMEYGELSVEEKERMAELDKQFNTPQFVEIDAPELEGKRLKIEYIALDVRSDEEKAQAVINGEHTVLHIPGYGSSYRSPEAFTKLLALREKKRVVVISQPSVGQSDPAPKEWRNERSFAPFAETTNRAVDAIRNAESKSGNQLTTEELSVVSSSMGSIIAAEFAAAHPEKVKDLVLLHPGGVNNENVLQLARRYFPETLGSKRATLGRKPLTEQQMAEMEQAYQEMFGKSSQQAFEEAGGEGEFSLQDAEQQETDIYQSVTKGIVKDSSANIARGKYIEGIRARVWEAFTIANGRMLETLPKVKANTYVVFGSKDKLFPADQMEKVKESLKDKPNVQTEILPTVHDEIYQRPRSYSVRVGTFLEDMRKKESSIDNN